MAVTCVTYSPDFAPVEMPSVAGQNDNAARRIWLYLLAVEPLTESDVKDARHDRVDTIFGMFVRHEFHAGGHFDSNQVRSCLCRLSDKHCQSCRGRKRGERLPIDIFREYRFKYGFAWLVVSCHSGTPNILHHLAGFSGFSRCIMGE